MTERGSTKDPPRFGNLAIKSRYITSYLRNQETQEVLASPEFLAACQWRSLVGINLQSTEMKTAHQLIASVCLALFWLPNADAQSTNDYHQWWHDRP
jgi:hypothetical protein